MIRTKIPASWVCLALLLAFTAGCGPSGAFADLFEENGGGGGGGGGGTTLFQYQVPANGSTVDATTRMSVTGSGLEAARFLIDGVLAAQDTEAPFEWTLDPADYVLGTHELRVIGTHDSGAEEGVASLVELERAVPLSEILDAIENLEPGHWYEIPNTRMLAAAYFNSDDRRGSISAVMTAVASAAYDTKRDRLVLWGGGPSYSGNEMYVFDLPTAAWLRLYDPSPVDPLDPINSLNRTMFPDGKPMLGHTFDFVEYIPPPVDRLYVGGNSAIWSAGTAGDSQIWLFDFETLTWDDSGPQTPSWGEGATAAIDGQGRVWQQGAGQEPNTLSVYEPSSEITTAHHQFSGWMNKKSTAVIHPVRNEYVLVGSGLTQIWDLDNPDAAPITLVTTGDKAMEDEIRPGLAYHPGTGLIVAWQGGKDVYTLDVDTAVWTKHESPGAVDPGPENDRATQGRFRYIPEPWDIFIEVSWVHTNVFVYRMPEID